MEEQIVEGPPLVDRSMIKRLTFVLSLGAVACASRPTPSPVPPAPPPVAQPAPPAVTRITAGGTPGSNSHKWGSRSFELRVIDGATLIRLDDEWTFQGVGMQPEDMGPNRHICTPWEAFPDDLARTVPAGIRACGDPIAHGVCEPIHAWFAATRPPAPTPTTTPDPSENAGLLGRASVACDAS